MIPSFWTILRQRWRHIFIQWDFGLALALAFAFGLIPGDHNIQDRYQVVLATEVSLGMAILGIVLAGLALIFVFLDDGMLRTLDSIGEGFAEDFFPFSFTAVVAAATTIVGTWCLIVTDQDNIAWIRFSIGITSGMFVYTTLGVLSLVRVAYRFCQLKVKRAQVSGPSEPPFE
jgi:hypothetical protein